MASYVIKGGQRLSGTISISGNKNSIVALLPACLLTDQEITLKNVPRIADVSVLTEILESLGAQIKWSDHTLKVRAGNIRDYKIPKELSRKLRASLLFAGALIGRVGKVEFDHPGGDLIGLRTIHPHLDGFLSLGCRVEIKDHNYKITKDTKGKEATIFMGEASVTATENLILASVLGKCVVKLKNCATEPHVVDLCKMLSKMGAKISGIGSNVLEIRGVKRLKGVTFSVSQDYLELGTYAIATAITGGEIILTGCSLDDLEPITYHLERMGISLRANSKGVKVSSSRLMSAHLKTNIWPGFPTDLMSAVLVLTTQASGTSLLHDWMYESRMFFVDKLISMGAKITIADPHRVLVSGKTKLMARSLESPDIRAGMALVLAALIARGESKIANAELIERGYEDMVGKLSSLGAHISRVD